MRSHIIWYHRTIINHVYHHGIILAGVSLQPYMPSRCNGFGSVFQQIRHHSAYKSLIGIHNKVFRLYINLYSTTIFQNLPGKP